MNEHIDRERLIALRLGRLGGAESRELLNHVAACAHCQQLAEETLAAGAHAREVARSLTDEEPRAPRRSRVIRWIAAAAAILALLIAIPLLRRKETPPPDPRTPTVSVPTPPAAAPARPAEWETIVAEATSRGAIALPASLAALQPAGDRFRAREGDPRVSDLRPFAEVIEDDRPLFRWPEERGATYMVLVGERDRIVAQSPSLSANRWQCDVALPRGRTYTWQVEVRRGDTTVTLPVPPAPRARFHIVDIEAKTQLDEARAARPADPLLLGILAARAGLRDEAVRNLGAAAGAGTPGAAALLASVRSWPEWRR